MFIHRCIQFAVFAAHILVLQLRIQVPLYPEISWRRTVTVICMWKFNRHEHGKSLPLCMCSLEIRSGVSGHPLSNGVTALGTIPGLSFRGTYSCLCSTPGLVSASVQGHSTSNPCFANPMSFHPRNSISYLVLRQGRLDRLPAVLLSGSTYGCIVRTTPLIAMSQTNTFPSPITEEEVRGWLDEYQKGNQVVIFQDRVEEDAPLTVTGTTSPLAGEFTGVATL